MSVLISNLNTIESVKLDIKSAIEAKGVSMSGVSFPDYPAAIGSIAGGIDEKDYTEKSVVISNLSNSASFVASSMFQNQFSTLLTVYLPSCEVINRNAFYNCYSLSEVYLPVCSNIGSSAFYGCYNISQITLPVCSAIGNYAFWNASILTTITLGSDNICALGSSVFGNTPIASGTGSIYVPSSLVEEYKSAANWSAFSTQIFPISE